MRAVAAASHEAPQSAETTQIFAAPQKKQRCSDLAEYHGFSYLYHKRRSGPEFTETAVRDGIIPKAQAMIHAQDVSLVGQVRAGVHDLILIRLWQSLISIRSYGRFSSTWGSHKSAYGSLEMCLKF